MVTLLDEHTMAQMVVNAILGGVAMVPVVMLLYFVVSGLSGSSSDK